MDEGEGRGRGRGCVGGRERMVRYDPPRAIV